MENLSTIKDLRNQLDEIYRRLARTDDTEEVAEIRRSAKEISDKIAQIIVENNGERNITQ